MEVPYHLSEMQLQFGADDLDRKVGVAASAAALKLSRCV